MKEKIQDKIRSHVASILKKDAIDFCDYQILCAELSKLNAQEAAKKFESESEERNEKMAKMFAEIWK